MSPYYMVTKNYLNLLMILSKLEINSIGTKRAPKDITSCYSLMLVEHGKF